MARCKCTDPDAVVGTCACVLQLGPSGKLTLSGTGQSSNPYIIDAAASVSTGFLGHMEYTTAGTATFTIASFPGAKFVHVWSVGGGGGGAGATAGAGVSIARGGGSGGNYSESWIPVASIPASVTVTVGAAGAAGAAANGNGGNGGQSSFGTLLTAPGGRGSSAAQAPVTGPRVTDGAVPEALGVGQIRTFGAPGDPGTQYATGFGNGGTGGMSGHGMGSGDSGGIMNGGTGEAGSSGNAFGGGGGGAVANNGGAFAGGVGGSGAVFLEVWG